MVFYGPSGTGKTTVANIIAQRSGRTLRRLNATTASLADIREVMDQVGTLLAPNGVLLYLKPVGIQIPRGRRLFAYRDHPLLLRQRYVYQHGCGRIRCAFLLARL